MANFKIKEYKTFNFPNSFSPLEQYFYYLMEFDFIPKEMPPQTIKNIFDAMTRDYLEEHLQFDVYAIIFERLYYGFAVKQIGLNKEMENLMEYVAKYLDDDPPMSILEVESKMRSYLSS